MLRFRILGSVELGAEGGDLRLGGAKVRAFLATLLLQPNHAVSLERLTEALWDSEEPPSAIANLRSYANRLRHALDQADHSGASRLVSSQGRYLLHVLPGELDAQVFEYLAQKGSAAVKRGAPEDALPLFERALGLWRGRAAEGVERVPSLTPYLAALEERRFAVTEDYAEAELGLGEISAAIARLRELLAEDPVRERAWAQLMLGLYRSGNTTGALAAYAEARATLVRRLGLEPGTELRELHRAILNRDPALGGFGRSVHVPGPRLPAAGRPRELPRGVPLTGRDAELVRLQEILRADVARELSPVAAICGPEGAGKSALAVRAAHLLAGQFGEGQLYVDLSRTDPAETSASLLQALGVPRDEIPASDGRAAAQLRSLLAGHRVLVVFDNVPEGADLNPLLPADPGCGVILTGRRTPPTLGDATHFCIGGLTADDALILLGEIAGPERLAFEPAAARELAALCEFLPRSLRAAAVRLDRQPELSVSALVRQLTERPPRLVPVERRLPA